LNVHVSIRLPTLRPLIDDALNAASIEIIDKPWTVKFHGRP